MHIWMVNNAGAVPNCYPADRSGGRLFAQGALPLSSSIVSWNIYV